MKNKKDYSRRKFISTLGAGTAALPLINSFASKNINLEEQTEFEIKKIPGAEQRNIIFILSDDHQI